MDETPVSLSQWRGRLVWAAAIAVAGVCLFLCYLRQARAALTYTLLVLLTGLVARGAARGSEGIVRALLAAGIMVAPEIGGPTNTLLGSPDHTGTGVPIMATLLLLDRIRPRWYLLNVLTDLMPFGATG
jgi:hypothetical protein